MLAVELRPSPSRLRALGRARRRGRALVLAVARARLARTGGARCAPSPSALVAAGARQPVARPGGTREGEGHRRGRRSTARPRRRSATAPRMTDAGPRRAAAPLRLRCPTSSRASSRRTTATGDDGTRLFAALSNGLADVPPDRLAGVDHGHRRRRARHPGLGRAPRLPRAAARARHRPPGRARPADQAARGAALRHRRQGPDDPRRRCMERGGTGSALVTVRRDGQQILAPARCAPARRSRCTVRDRAWRPERRRDRGRGARRTS